MTENESGLREIPASEILDKIQNGEDVEYDSVIVRDDLELNKLNLLKQYIERTEFQRTILKLPEEAKLIKSKIKITSSNIEGSVVFDNTILPKEIDFRGSNFGKKADFSGSQFNGDTSFLESQFNGNVHFSGSQFKANLTFFDKSQFRKYADFSGSQFKSYIYFIKSHFGEDASFVDSEFSEKADFSRSQFNGTAYFDGAIFSSSACFSSQFDGNVSFSGCQFGQNASFNDSQFSRNAYFRSTFNGDAFFNGCAFIGDAFFSGCTFIGDAFFSGTKFSGDALFYDTNFQKPFSLEQIKYDRLYIRWREFTKPRYQRKFLENWRRINNLDYEDTAYLLLIDNFKNLGLYEDADDCYYIYRIERRRALPLIYKPFDWMLWLFYGYGVKPLRPLGWLVILLLAFGLLYSATGNSPTEALNTSLTLSLSGTQLIENPNHPVTAMQYWIFTSEKLLASLFSAMFLVSVGRTIIR